MDRKVETNGVPFLTKGVSPVRVTTGTSGGVLEYQQDSHGPSEEVVVGFFLRGHSCSLFGFLPSCQGVTPGVETGSEDLGSKYQLLRLR